MDLTIGLASLGSLYDDLLSEMLDHQGVAYEIVRPGAVEQKYPLVLVSKNSEQAYSLARASCSSESDIIVVENVVTFDIVLGLLAGTVLDRRDNFDMTVNKEEEKLLSAIRERLFQLGVPFVRKWYWPKAAPAACVFSHDIDYFRYTPFHKQVLRQSANPIRMARLTFDSLLRRQDYGWNIPETIALEQEHGFKSTFFFQMSYGDDDHLLDQSVGMLKEKAFEIGLHSSRGSAHKDLESLRSELSTFRAKVGFDAEGLRYHILKFEVPRTWEIEADAGLEYDATFYWNRFFGFRAGTCHPYHPFSRVSKLPIIELPTGYMDWTSLHRNQGAQEQLETLETTLRTIERYHGVLVSNFHNTYLNRETFPSIWATFRHLLAVAKERNYWVATAQECADWWRFRSSAVIHPRLDSGEVVCSSNVAVVIERESRPDQMVLTPSPSSE